MNFSDTQVRTAFEISFPFSLSRELLFILQNSLQKSLSVQDHLCVPPNPDAERLGKQVWGASLSMQPRPQDAGRVYTVLPGLPQTEHQAEALEPQGTVGCKGPGRQ